MLETHLGVLRWKVVGQNLLGEVVEQPNQSLCQDHHHTIESMQIPLSRNWPQAKGAGLRRGIYQEFALPV